MLRIERVVTKELGDETCYAAWSDKKQFSWHGKSLDRLLLLLFYSPRLVLGSVSRSIDKKKSQRKLSTNSGQKIKRGP
jgi:hypothetical protein